MTATADDVAAASAAYAFNVLPEISALPAPEAYQRLLLLFQTAISLYAESAARGLPEPSDN